METGINSGTAHGFADGDLDLNGDRLREECGVFGVYNHPDAAAITAIGLHALQHRGQEAAGIVVYDGKRFHSERRLGLVGDTFSDSRVIDRLPGNVAVGHVRYSTTGETLLRNVQPLFAELDGGGFAVGHNGNLTNGISLRRQLVREGAIMQSTTDTEAILHLVARSRKPRFMDRFVDALRMLEGAYSLVALTNKKLIGARDPLGIRPLVLGKLGDAHILASETCALDIIGATYVRDIENGEVIVIDEDGVQSYKGHGRACGDGGRAVPRHAAHRLHHQRPPVGHRAGQPHRRAGSHAGLRLRPCPRPSRDGRRLPVLQLAGAGQEPAAMGSERQVASGPAEHGKLAGFPVAG